MHMHERAITGHVDRLLKSAVEAGTILRPGLRVLDFGCGEGAAVRLLRARGFDAKGVDVIDFWSQTETSSDVRDHLRLASLTPYAMPFHGSTFDLIVSHMVFEHVMDYRAVFRELRRVMAPDGVAVHLFPPRWKPLEPHVYVPLATVLRSRPYLAFWALAGVRNEFQQGKPWREVTALNYRYLREETHYPSERQIRQWASDEGLNATFLASHRGRLATVALRFLQRKLVLRHGHHAAETR